MALKEKYDNLINYAQQPKVDNLSISENNNVLCISGSASNEVKDHIWRLYNQIDPDMRAGDLVLDIKVDNNSEEIYEIKSGDSLSKIAQKYPNMTWQKIYEANKDTIKDPNVIMPGQKIKIPK
ncbi:MAG: LysM peptidoglycan-binding domain-containing protein [Prevotellaceae bacterium]|jgi:nucleoid-associated protein YgaU|nr:LysM peptidoglycan-binding domain-containing protein [Prevotellaceae bacterium]